MAINSIESIEAAAKQAIDVVAALPWYGQTQKGVYTGKRPINNDGITSDQVNMVAVWEGAAGLAGNNTVRCIVLESNPRRVDLRGGIHLVIDQLNRNGGDDITRLEYLFGVGEESKIDKGRERLVQTVLGNIAQLRPQYV